MYSAPHMGMGMHQQPGPMHPGPGTNRIAFILLLLCCLCLQVEEGMEWVLLNHLEWEFLTILILFQVSWKGMPERSSPLPTNI